jgi:hypothetical protein
VPPTAPSASFVIAVIWASIGPGIGFTPKIAPTPAKQAAIPASGCRPTLANAAAPSGTRIRYPASVAMLERTPTKIRTNASNRRGEARTRSVISAAISPLPSATPAPMRAMNVTATTPKPAKFGTKDVKMNRIPSAERRLWIGIVTSSRW